MLRTLFVLLLAGAGLANSLRGPFHALLFYLWIAYFRPESWVWGGIITEVPLSLLAGIWALCLAVGSGKALRVDARLALLLVLLLHTFVSSTASVHQNWVWPYWTDFLKAVSITYLVAVLVTDVRRLRLTFLVIVLSLGFEATKQGWAQLLLNPGGKNYNAIPFLGDENGVAVGMFMLVPLAAALIGTEARLWAKGSLAFVMVGVVYRGVTTYSRGGFLTLVSIVGMYVLRSRRKLVALVATVLMAAGLSVVMNDAFWERINSIRVVEMEPGLVDDVSADDASTMGRLHFWTVAVLMANDRPFTGVGHNGYNAAYNSYDTSGGEFNRWRSVHSSWFGVLSELGYPGLLLYLGILLLALRACWRVRRLGGGDPAIAGLVPFATAIETSLVAAMVGGTFVIFQYSEMLWHMVGLSIALNRIASARTAAREAAEEAPGSPDRTQFKMPVSARSIAR